MADKKQVFVTGFCGMGFHEGNKPVSPSGKAMKTCMRVVRADRGERVWYCGCTCHEQLDKMYEMMGMERVVQQNPDYKPEADLKKLRESLQAIRTTRVEVAVAKVEIKESIAPGELPPVPVVEFGETASGRKARGQLEDEVQKATDMWVMLKATQPCTPAWVADMIDAENPPSTGAINAVFERWAAYGFATVEKKPTRFTGYTPAGVEHGLHYLKVKYKTEKRTANR